MIEQGIRIENIHEVQTALGLIAIAMAFRKDIRFEVRKRQKNICDCCGEKYVPLQTHHRQPESLGGASSKIENAVGLCNTCHKEVDIETFTTGRQYPQVHTRDSYYPQGNGLENDNY